MAETSTLEGTLVALTAREYASFKARNGDQLPGGITRKAYVVPDFDQAPVEIKVDEMQYVELSKASFGATVTMLCELQARNSGNQAIIERRCLSIVRAVVNA